MRETPKLPITDNSGQTWTFCDVQSLVIQTGSLAKAARRLNTDSRVLRKLGIRTPAEDVRQWSAGNSHQLINVILQHESVKGAAKHLHVSVTFLKSLLVEHGWEIYHPEPDEEAARALMEKFGSPILVARMLSTTPNQIKKVVPDWKDLRDPTKAGDHSIRTGRIAERYFEAKRGEHITENLVEKNHNSPGYDYVDDTFKRVNVKATVQGSSGGWTWELDPHENVDNYALVRMDRNKKPLGYHIYPRNWLGFQQPAQIHTNDSTVLIQSHRANGKVAVTMKDPVPEGVPTPTN